MRDIILLMSFCLIAVGYIMYSQLAGTFFGFGTTVEAESPFYFYKISRNFVILFFGLFFILCRLFVKELLSITEEEKAGKAKLRLQADLEVQTRRGLRQKLEEKERLLTVATLALEEKNKMLSHLKTNLQEIHSNADIAIRSQLRPISHTIDRNLKKQDDWSQFQVYFAQVHPQFFHRLQSSFPTLNSNDLRLCAYLRLNLSTKEMASLLHINHQSVQKARYRLKKKLSLPPEKDLQVFIAHF